MRQRHEQEVPPAPGPASGGGTRLPGAALPDRGAGSERLDRGDPPEAQQARAELVGRRSSARGATPSGSRAGSRPCARCRATCSPRG
jgi:hypothetical protein